MASQSKQNQIWTTTIFRIGWGRCLEQPPTHHFLMSVLRCFVSAVGISQLHEGWSNGIISLVEQKWDVVFLHPFLSVFSYGKSIINWLIMNFFVGIIFDITSTHSYAHLELFLLNLEFFVSNWNSKWNA